MIFYLFLMVCLAALAGKNANSRPKFFFSVLILTLLLGLKSDNIGNDTPNYIEVFYRLKYFSTWSDPSSRFEIGYQIYNKLLGLLFDNHQALFIVTGIICMCCVAFGISQYSLNWQYSLMLFVGFRFYYFFMSGLRQSIAVSLVFVSYYFLKSRKLIPFVLIVLFASTFHFSALLFLFAIPISKMNIERMAIGVIFAGVIFALLLFDPLLKIALGYLPSYYSHYLETEAASSNNITDFINALLPCLIIYFAYQTDYLHKNSVNTDLNNSAISNNKTLTLVSNDDTLILFLVVSAGLSLVATRASILDRMAQYYWIFAIVLLPNILFSIKDKKLRSVCYYIVSVLVIAYNISILVLRPEWNNVVPYEFFW